MSKFVALIVRVAVMAGIAGGATACGEVQIPFFGGNQAANQFPDTDEQQLTQEEPLQIQPLDPQAQVNEPTQNQPTQQQAPEAQDSPTTPLPAQPDDNQPVRGLW